jgi:hypothetical protein
MHSGSCGSSIGIVAYYATGLDEYNLNLSRDRIFVSSPHSSHNKKSGLALGVHPASRSTSIGGKENVLRAKWPSGEVGHSSPSGAPNVMS